VPLDIFDGGFPETLTSNAWDGTDAVAGRTGRQATQWALATPIPETPRWLRPTPADPRDFTDPRVGWGIILPDGPDLSDDAKSRADDAPEPIRALVASRPNAKVLRWSRSLGTLAVADYASGGNIPLSGAPEGSAPEALPRYLLLYGGPDVLPWALQYTLNAGRFVGRLDLTGEPLERYVTALLNGWQDSEARYDQPVVWAADFGGADMSALMRSAIAVKVAESLQDDAEMPGCVFLDGDVGPATGVALRDTLVSARPALVVTTSHGMTGPISDTDAMRRNLGVPVDQLRQPVSPDDLLAAWQPDGAIWYAHACCSAGTDKPSAYSALLEPESGLPELLDALAGIGPAVAPLPTALLGAPKPLRAFIGHVEPTFDWTIRLPWTRQHLTDSTRTALYDGLCSGEPVGYALHRVWRHIGELEKALREATRLVNRGRATASRGLTAALYCQLAAQDRGGLVVLGDPVVALPLPTPPAPGAAAAVPGVAPVDPDGPRR
jgi:hypothetical protein